MNPGLNIYLPLVYNKQDGPFKTTKTIKDAVFQNLKMLIFTNPGERIMDKNFGVGVNRFLFENFTTDTIDKLKERIRTQILSYMSYLTINKIDIFQMEGTLNGFYMKLWTTIQGIAESVLFDFSVQERNR